MKKALTFFDNNILLILTLAFLIFIPLYPKFPLIAIPDTYISIRLEDFLTALMTAIYGIQILRKKINVPKSYLKYFILFWLAVFISYVWGAFVSHTVQFPKIGFLHAARRIQYMVPFFLAFSAVSHSLSHSKDLRTQLSKYFTTISWVVFVVCLYAIGQKSSAAFQPVRDFFENIYKTNSLPIIRDVAYFFFRFFDFPAVQTMNSEFAKGFLLNLTPESRVSSTFAGHYDLAAYLVFFIPIIAAFIISKRSRILNWLTYIASILTLILTASRASFAAFGVSIGIYLLYTRKWKMLFATVLITLMLMFLNKDMTDRFKDMFQKKRVFQNVQTGALIIDQDISAENLPAGTQFISEGQATKVEVNKEDTQKLKDQLIKKEVEEAKKSGKEISQEEAARLVDDKYKALTQFVARDVIAGDTSLATRTQVEWPRAVRSFLSNPLFGTGVSSITESTDGDFFRLIGETGILGSAIFMFIIISFVKIVFDTTQKHKEFSIIGLSYIAGIIALLANAVLIDVFEASKVAFIFWTVSGIFLAVSENLRHSHLKKA
ncbi:MAG: O-antigen ligase family protein [Patescibacteria group bacterium]